MTFGPNDVDLFAAGADAPLGTLLAARTMPTPASLAGVPAEPAVAASTLPASTTGSKTTMPARRRRLSAATACGRSFRPIRSPPRWITDGEPFPEIAAAET